MTLYSQITKQLVVCGSYLTTSRKLLHGKNGMLVIFVLITLVVIVTSIATFPDKILASFIYKCILSVSHFLSNNSSCFGIHITVSIVYQSVTLLCVVKITLSTIFKHTPNHI